MIILEQVSKNYGDRTVLSEISTQFEIGKVYGIVGENGAGKTTLFKCMAGLESYQGDIRTVNNVELKSSLGFLMAESYFFSKMTGAEYIQLLCNARKVSPGNMKERNIFDLPLDQYAATYSTGMKKKLALTAILMQENMYFILDEPFNGVDIQSNLIITEIIHRLRDMGKLVIISSHIFSTLSDTCDAIYLLKGGQFAKKVTKDEFPDLEQEMKQLTIGSKIDQLLLR